MLNELWNKARDYFSTSLPKETFDLWIAPIKPRSLENGLLTLEVPNRFHALWLEKNTKNKILELLKPSVADIANLGFVWRDSPLSKKMDGPLPAWKISQEPQLDKKAGPKVIPFNQKYSFERFVVGPTNRFAHASSLAVAQNPGRQFNPLFIYGHAGLGKTHLLHAIGQMMFKTSSSMKIIYASSETFVNEYVESLKNKSVEAYRGFYRNSDCLLIDDIQFLVGKEHSEQEFFHTFNTLFETSRQIVLTSDRAPKDLQPLEGRLISRFEWGVVADIKPPDFETRLAILRKKAEFESVVIPDAILQLLAQNIKSNIRVLEGSLNNLIAYACLTGSPVNAETVEQILKQLKEEDVKEFDIMPSIAKIQEVVAKNLHVTVNDLKDKSRSAGKVAARQLAMYLSREITQSSLEEIGRHFGGKDHSTVMHAVNKVSALIQKDAFYASFVNKLEKGVKNSVDNA